MKRIVLDARCRMCNGRLIKQQFLVLKEQAELLQPHVRKFYETEQTCKECKDNQ